uniref:Uncharacterized protein n=1 Tax=Helianthus annuus TaxID=4232 RepID=A0A251SH01_HELAN
MEVCLSYIRPCVMVKKYNAPTMGHYSTRVIPVSMGHYSIKWCKSMWVCQSMGNLIGGS